MKKYGLSVRAECTETEKRKSVIMIQIKKNWADMMIIFKFAVIPTALMVLFIGRPCQGAGLLVADGGFGGLLEIEEHVVIVTINNGIAVTEVTQVFRNTEQREVEALYTFPVPRDASVANFSMWINDREMIGEVVEKQRAREIYNSYKRKRRDPGLLEQTDFKSFEMRIYPIGPGAKQKVKVTYYQELPYDHDWATYVYPLATSTRPGVDMSVKKTFSLSVHVKSETPIAAMESPSHSKEMVIARHADVYMQGSLEISGGSLARDVVLSYQIKRPQTGLDILCSKQNNEDGFFYLTLTAGEELAGTNSPMDYLFILDISGSMAHDGKLNLSQKTIGSFVDTLGDKDRLEIITFNIQANALFNQLRTAQAATKSEARTYLASQAASGGTSLRPALSAAYRYADPDRTLNVVIFSDGMTKQDERNMLIKSINERPVNVRVFCVGVGNEINRSLLKQIAEDSGGLASFLSREDDFERQARSFRRKLIHPAATNVRIQFEGLEVYEVEPRILPNLYHGAPLRLFGRYRGGGKAGIHLQAEVNGREIKTKGDIVFPEEDLQNPQIERMWAWHRIQNLLTQTNRSQDSVSEIVQLGEMFSIVTEYTSFLVLENDQEYQRWKIERRNAMQIKQDRQSQQALALQLESLRLKAANKLGPKMTSPSTSGPILAKSADSVKITAPITQSPPTAPTPRQNPPRKHRRVDTPMRSKGKGGGPIGPIMAVIAGYLEIKKRRQQRKAV